MEVSYLCSLWLLFLQQLCPGPRNVLGVTIWEFLQFMLKADIFLLVRLKLKNERKMNSISVWPWAPLRWCVCSNETPGKSTMKVIQRLGAQMLGGGQISHILRHLLGCFWTKSSGNKSEWQGSVIKRLKDE